MICKVCKSKIAFSQAYSQTCISARLAARALALPGSRLACAQPGHRGARLRSARACPPANLRAASPGPSPGPAAVLVIWLLLEDRPVL